MPDFTRRRTTITGSILALEAEVGAAVLDDKPIDMAAINAARDELAALDLAEAAANERTRTEEAEAREKMRAEALGQMEVHAEAYLGALTASQRHATALVDQLAVIESQRADMAALMHKLGLAVPDVLTANESRTIISRLLAAELNRLGQNSRYGVMDWISVQPVKSWRDHVAKKLVPSLNLGKEEQ